MIGDPIATRSSLPRPKTRPKAQALLPGVALGVGPAPPSTEITTSHNDTFLSTSARALSRNTSAWNSAADIPDVRGFLAKNPRYSELNLEINKAYVRLAELFQDIYDPDRNFAPSWYGFAPFASREAGRGIRASEKLTKLLEALGQPPKHSARWEKELDQEYSDPDEREMASQVLNLLGPAPARQGEPSPQGIGDLTHLGVAASRLGKLVRKQEGSAAERLARVSRTIRNMLENGNKLIVTEIGVAGQDYLEFRQGRQPSPAQVLEEFTLAGTPKNSRQAKEIYDELEDRVQSGQDYLLDWDQSFPADKYDRSNFIVASFAAYEAARLEADPKIKQRYIEQAGILMAFREQRDVVQPAFEDTFDPNEVSRVATMEMMTPWVEVPTNQFEWGFREFAGQHLPRRDSNPFTPRAAEYNWGDFSTRWLGIVDFFGQVNPNPESIWPMPSPDPNTPIEG